MTSQQGMFGNPYYRYAGGYSSSMYTFKGAALDNKLEYRVSMVNGSNMLMNGSYNYYKDFGMNAQSVNFGLTEGNTLQEMQMMYHNDDGKSSYAFTYGMLQEKNGTVLGSTGLLNPTGSALTNYFEFKAIQYVGQGFYLLGRYGLGISSVMQRDSGFDAFYNFTPIVSQSVSLGVYKEKLFGFNGSLFFIYNQPNMAISGSATMRAFDKEGNITDIGDVSFVKSGAVERQYEVGYTYYYKQYTMSFSSILRQNPYRLANVDVDGLFMVKFGMTI
jgi:hypothetical protein